jgi:putative ABC transport system permease protein
MAHERGAVAALAVLVLVVTVVVVAIPRWLESSYDDALQQLVREAPPEARLVEARSGRVPYADAPAIQAALEQARTGLGPGHQRILGAGYWSVAVPDLAMTTPDGAPRFPSRQLALRLQSEWQSKVRLVEGVFATSVGSAPAPPTLDSGQPAAVLDIVLTPAVADDLDLAIGDVVFLFDPTAEPLAVRLTGLVEPIDPYDPFWAGLGRAIVASHEPSDNDDLYRGVALLPEAAYDSIAELDSSGLDTRLRYPLASPDLLRDDDVPALRAELRTARTQGIPGAVALPGNSFLTSRLTLLSGLDPLFEQHLEQRRAAAAVSAVELASLLLLGAAVLWLAARAAGARRDVAWVSVRARGAAPTQLVGWLTTEQAVIAVPAVVAGAVLARWVVPGEDNAVSWWLAALVLATALFSLPAVAWRRLHAVSVTAARGRTSRFGPSARRWSGELLLVVLAGLAVLAVSRRGISAGATPTGGDPLLALAPGLVALAVGAIVLRAAPLLLRAWARTLAKRPSLVPFLAVTSAARSQRVLAVPLLVVIVAVSSATFFAAIVSTVQRGQTVAAWDEVGADVAVSGLTFLPDRLAAVADVSGVETALGVYVEDGTVGSDDIADRPVRVVVVDTIAALEAFASAPTEPALPASLRTSSVGQVGVVVSGDVLSDIASPVVSFAGAEVDVTEVGRVSGFPGIDPGFDVVVIDRAVAEAATGRTFHPNQARLFGEGIDRASLDARLAEFAVPLDIHERAQALAARQDGPLLAGTLDLLRVGVVLCAAAAGAAGLFGVLATARSRAWRLALLHTLGLDRGGIRRLGLAELVPMLLVTLITGAVLGVLAALLLVDSIDLSPFVGASSRGVDVTIAIVPTLAVVAAAGLAVVLAVLAGASLARRRIPAQVLRTDTINTEWQ